MARIFASFNLVSCVVFFFLFYSIYVFCRYFCQCLCFGLILAILSTRQYYSKYFPISLFLIFCRVPAICFLFHWKCTKFIASMCITIRLYILFADVLSFPLRLYFFLLSCVSVGTFGIFTHSLVFRWNLFISKFKMRGAKTIWC